MSSPELAFRISAESSQAREQLRRVAEQLRGLATSARQGLSGMPSLADGLGRVGAAGQAAGQAAQRFGVGLAGAFPQIAVASGAFQRLQSSAFGLPPLMGAAAVAGTALGAALAAVGAKSVAAFAAMETQMLTTTQVIRATGGAAGKSWGDINRLAIDLGRNTLASTEGVRKAATQLLTFRSIAGETFDRTMRAAQDLSAVGFGSIESAAVQLGKALENPEQGLAALTEVGVSFSGAQKEVIKQLMATGQVAAAQGLILQQIEAQVGGAGGAAGGGLAGAFDTLAENSGRLFEIIGGGLVKMTALDSVVGTIAKGIGAINDTVTADPNIAAIKAAAAARDAALQDLADDDARGDWNPMKLNPAQRAALLADINEFNNQVIALTRERLEAERAAADKSAEEQRLMAEERFNGVVTALQREAEQAGMTKTEIEALNAARKAGVDPSLPENVARYQQILDLVRQTAAARAQATGEKLLVDLTQEAELQRLIAAHGEDSAEVTRARAAAEREALVQQIEAAGYSEDLAAAILEAFDNAEALAGVNMAPGIAAARAEAVGLAAQLGVALNTAVQIRALNALETAKVEFSPGGRALAAYGSRAPGGTAPQQAIATRNAPKKVPRAAGGVGSGGGLDRDSVAGLAAEGVALMRQLELVQTAVAEKVRAGLMTAAEGSEAMADAKVRAANQLADLIAKLDMLGPAGKAAAETARQALKGLGIEAESVGAKLQASIVDSFEDNFARSIATGKNAMSAFADHVKMELARAFTQKFITPLISPLINGVMGLFGGIFGSAQGNVISAGQVVPFAKGGLPQLGEHSNSIVSRPTLFAMGGAQTGLMGEAGPEAILPLRNGPGGMGVLAKGPGGTGTLPLQRMAGGNLGVVIPDLSARLRPPQAFARGGVVGRLSDPPLLGNSVSGGASAAGRARPMNVVINNNHRGAEVTATERQGSDGMSMDIVIEQIEGALADRARRGVGSLSGVLGADFGLSRQGR